MRFFNFNRQVDFDVRYFVIFPDEAEKREFADTFCAAALSNQHAPFASATADGVLVAIIMARRLFVDYWKKRHPRVQFVEAKNLEATWGDSL